MGAPPETIRCLHSKVILIVIFISCSVFAVYLGNLVGNTVERRHHVLFEEPFPAGWDNTNPLTAAVLCLLLLVILAPNDGVWR